MKKSFSLLLALFALSTPALAAQMSESDSEIMTNVMKKGTWETTVSFSNVTCRWKSLGATICSYVHTNGNRDSFSWFNAAKAANIIHYYKPYRQLDNGLLEVSIQNLVCENGICSYE